MWKGRTGFGLLLVCLFGCSRNIPQTIVLDKKVHHIGQDTIPSWYMPLPENDTLMYIFNMSNPGDSGFALGFIYRGDDFLIEINGDAVEYKPDEDELYCDSIKEPFLSAWLELDGDTAYANSLRILMDNSEFKPCVVSIQKDVLKKGENSVYFTRLDEDFMLSAIVLSDDEALRSLFHYHLWKIPQPVNPIS